MNRILLVLLIFLLNTTICYCETTYTFNGNKIYSSNGITYTNMVIQLIHQMAKVIGPMEIKFTVLMG